MGLLATHCLMDKGKGIFRYNAIGIDKEDDVSRTFPRTGVSCPGGPGMSGESYQFAGKGIDNLDRIVGGSVIYNNDFKAVIL
jgi:hypothetical protein